MNKIQDYAIIGNCRSAALVSKSGAIEWLCWPHFDSPPVFAGLLDPHQGQWSITPAGSYQIHRQYIDDTFVLQTTFLTSGGCAVLTDVMPVMSEQEKGQRLWPEQEILRKLECTQGEVKVSFHYDLGNGHALNFKGKTLGIQVKINGGRLILRSNVALRLSTSGIDSSFIIRQGEVFYFSLSFSTEAPAVLPPADRLAEAAIERSVRWWTGFASGVKYEGLYRDAVVRSALVLKLMSHAPSGAIIASPTSSLPEKIGGDINWDYRYCWLRDASLTTHALMNLQLRDEAQAFVNWLLHATNLSRPKLKVLYDIYGRRPHSEKTLPELMGYFDSRPVRVGNGAAQQDQLDVYGEVICAAVNIFSDVRQIDGETQHMLQQLGDYICRHWDQDDAGMWEIRGIKEHFTHSLLLCWAGLQGLLDLHQKGLLPKLSLNKIRITHERLTRALSTLAWSDERQTFTAVLRGKGVDANLLLLSWYKFIPADDIRMRRTYERLQQELASSNGLLYRNRLFDEGAFILCSLWAVDFLASGGGSLTEAKTLFEHVLSFANDVGLMAEELDPTTGDLLGNFPLAFTHAGIINAAAVIEKRKAKDNAALPGKVNV
jgi:GH15 family glucan-1,4-alpha-glucosidase